MPLSITPLSRCLGAEVTGVDLSKPMAAADVAAIEDALTTHLLVVIRDQTLDPERLLTALRLFGDTMHQHLSDMLMEAHPEIAVLDSRTSPVEADGMAVPLGSRDWHTDHTNHARPPNFTGLYAVALPRSGGGDTSFANMHAAYDALPARFRAELDTLRTHNKIEDSDYVSPADKDRFGRVQVHPLIRTHPVTGKKAIYIHPGKTVKLDGMDPEKSHAFIDDLMDRVIQPEIVYRHKWRVGDLLLCDNRALLHIAHRDYDAGEGRVMHRVLLEGDVPR
ncbi:MAG: TauD/TfdA dioxygenase family protein [Methyloligellaceae bacterium]